MLLLRESFVFSQLCTTPSLYIYFYSLLSSLYIFLFNVFFIFNYYSKKIVGKLPQMVVKWCLIFIEEAGFRCTANIPCSLMHRCSGVAITICISAPRLYCAWDLLIIFNFSFIRANLVLVNTATLAPLMCSDLQDWGLAGALALGEGFYCIRTSEFQPLYYSFPPHLFPGLLHFQGLFRKYKT